MSVRSDLGGYELGLLLEARVSGNGKKKKDATPSDLHVGTSPRSETRCERFHPRPPAWHGEARRGSRCTFGSTVTADGERIQNTPRRWRKEEREVPGFWRPVEAMTCYFHGRAVPTTRCPCEGRGEGGRIVCRADHLAS